MKFIFSIACAMTFYGLSNRAHAAIPKAPSNLTARTVSATQINLSWTDNSTDEWGFKIERQTAAGPITTIVTAANVRTFNNTGLTANTRYSYRIFSYNGSGNSSYSWTITVSTTTPAAPKNLLATTTGALEIALTWTSGSSDVTGFLLERTDAAGTIKQIPIPLSQPYLDSGLAATTTYSYRIRACNGSLNSAYSNTSSTKTTTATGPYYFDPNAVHGWGTQASPWSSTTFVNNFSFRPGDALYLKRGTTLKSALSPKGNGSPGKPITLGAYTGSDNSTAAPIVDVSGLGSRFAIGLIDQSYWTIRDLEIRNWWSTASPWPALPAVGTPRQDRYGIMVTKTAAAGARSGIHIVGNIVRSVYDEGGAGIWVGTDIWNGRDPGDIWDDILIEGNTVSFSYWRGIVFWHRIQSPLPARGSWNLSTHVIIRNNQVSNTGSDGILMLGTSSGLIEKNTVNGAGAAQPINNTDLYQVGIQVQYQRDSIIQFNEVSGTRLLPLGNDGQAFDNDQYADGTTTFQYNYTHDNQSGFLLDETENLAPGAGGQTIARYNISVNDGFAARPAPAHRFFVSFRGNALIYNNTFYNDAGGGFFNDVASANVPLNIFRNNIFVGDTADWNHDTFTNNAYFGTLSVPVTEPSGAVISNPEFINPTNAPSGLKLNPFSPLIGVGAVIAQNGGRDFFGTSVSAASATDVGAAVRDHNQGSQLQINQVLGANDYLKSPNGQYRLLMQTDGNLVIYNASNTAVWNSQTWGMPAQYATLTQGGNLVVYGSSHIYWSSNVNPGVGPAYYASLLDDGTLAIYLPHMGSPGLVWSSKM
jgi:parallel beta-helix repeat protein